ncbi:MAG: low molecular weight phosphotyrosine protein phosphatase [Acidimicrobiia bacterium]|nr:low molecular weight phosphotyrosine protein phosphatase [Acidimicrobiia bacterium]
MRILVLCTGNIGRSPLAEVMLRKALASGLGVEDAELADRGFVVTSAGIAAPEGHPASRRSIAVAAGRGLDLSNHSATQLTALAVAAADRIYCMDGGQLAAVKAIDPAAASKTGLIAGEGIEIPDPHYQDDEFFWRVAQQVEAAALSRAAELLEQVS